MVRLASYVADRYELAPDLKTENQGTVGDSCFTRISFTSASPLRSMVLYLSPDHRFLSSDMMDVSVDPAISRLKGAKAVALELERDESPSTGAPGAPVTLVVFSDFECPFCRNFETLFRQLPPDIRSKTRVVFKHMPLPMHPWALAAAKTAICAEAQDKDSFWRLHDYLFDNQLSITPETFPARVQDFSKDNSSLDLGQINTCVAHGDAQATLDRDEKLAYKFKIQAVPTVFINGVRKTSFASPSDLKFALEEAIATQDRERLKASSATAANVKPTSSQN